MLTLKSQPDISPGKQVYLVTTKDCNLEHAAMEGNMQIC